MALDEYETSGQQPNNSSSEKCSDHEATQPLELVTPQPAVASEITSHALKRFNLYGWRPDPILSDDENYMDIVLLITRSSVCHWQGHMGCIIVKPMASVPSLSLSNDYYVNDDQRSQEDSVCRCQRRLYRAVIGAANNTPLFNESDSDIHAEIDALGQACRSRQSTENCTAYITMPPCKRCFAALVTFGIKRIVSRSLPPVIIQNVARREGIELFSFSQEIKRRQMERINGLVNRERTDEDLMRFAELRRLKRVESRKGKQARGVVQATLGGSVHSEDEQPILD